MVPSVSSENREYLPVDLHQNDTVISNLAFGIYDSDEWVLAIICSTLHSLWVRTVCGQLETRIRYSNTLGWNTFPFPSLNEEQLSQLNESARKILIVREKHFPKSIADLYDKESMPADLKSAHNANDLLLEKFYREEPFDTDEERLEHLFNRYVQMTQGRTK